MRASRAFLLLLAALFALAGVPGLISIDPAVDAGINPATADAMAEVRVIYGGLNLAFCGFFLWSCVEAPRLRSGLILAALLMATTAASRAIGVLVDGARSTYQLGSLSLELILLIVALWLIFRRVVEN